MSFLIILLITEPFLLFFKPTWHPIYFHTFVVPVIIILTALLYLQKSDKQYVEFILPSLFLGWVFFLFSVRFITDILQKHSLAYWGLLPVLSITIFLVLYYILSDFSVTLRPGTLIAITATTMSCLAIVQALFKYHPWNVTGTFGNPTNLGAYLAVCLPYTFKPKFLYGVPLFIAIALTQSASALLGATVAILIYLFFKNRNEFYPVLIICIISIIAFIFLNPTFFNLYGKFSLWKTVLIQGMTHPITGYGPGSIEVSQFTAYKIDTWWTSTHNILVHIFYEFGIIGLLITLAFFIKDIILKPRLTALKKTAFNSSVVFIIISMSFISYHIFPVVVLQALNLAILKRNDK